MQGDHEARDHVAWWPATPSPRATCWPWPGWPGIQAAKQTPDLIPLCHPLLVGSVFVNFTIGDDHVEVEAQVETVDRTGVEMEALTACAVAALTIYDMCKSVDRSMAIGELTLWEKTGGRSGIYRRPVEPTKTASIAATGD